MAAVCVCGRNARWLCGQRVDGPSEVQSGGGNAVVVVMSDAGEWKRDEWRRGESPDVRRLSRGRQKGEEKQRQWVVVVCVVVVDGVWTETSQVREV